MKVKLVCCLFSFLLPATSQTNSPGSANSEYTRQADALLRSMTVEEKIGQLNQVFDFKDPVPGLPVAPVNYEDSIRKGQIGSLLFVTDPREINRLQKIAMTEQRLHIPILFAFDVIHGFDTEFPVPLAMAASWDPALVQTAQSDSAEEAAHSGIRWAFAPMVDIARDPRWGRISEGAGEDPYLGAAIAKAQVIGFQGTAEKPKPFLATLKHFAGYGAAEGGRDYDASYIPEELLQNVYLPPFRAGVEAGAATVMSAYMDLNDVPASGNGHLLQDILRNDWKFEGFVVSDAFAIGDLVTHGFAKDGADAAERALTAGVNMDMGSGTFLNKAPALVRSGKISPGRLDDLVRPILAAKFRIGLFEHPYADATGQTHAQMLSKHKHDARVAATESVVLLKNEGHLLPLSKDIGRIAVIGPLGDSALDMNGPWSLTADPHDTTTVLQGLRKKLPNSTIEFSPGVQIVKTYSSQFDSIIGPKPAAVWTREEAAAQRERALRIARQSDLVVMTLGENSMMDFEYASRASLRLPGAQQELLEQAVALGKPVVLLLFSTRPLDLSWAHANVPAILDCYFGGTESGNAIADLLMGDAVPSGKLPVTWPRSVGQAPIYYAHNLSHKPYTAEDFKSRYWDLPTSPEFAFGFGLSYSQFSFTNLRASNAAIGLKDTLTVTVNVKNTGARPATEVAQLYLHQRYGSASRPVRELKGFRRISLEAGRDEDVSFRVGPKEREYWSKTAGTWLLEPTEFDVWAGNSSEAQLHTSFVVRK